MKKNHDNAIKSPVLMSLHTFVRRPGDAKYKIKQNTTGTRQYRQLQILITLKCNK